MRIHCKKKACGFPVPSQYVTNIFLHCRIKHDKKILNETDIKMTLNSQANIIDMGTEKKYISDFC